MLGFVLEFLGCTDTAISMYLCCNDDCRECFIYQVLGRSLCAYTPTLPAYLHLPTYLHKILPTHSLALLFTIESPSQPACPFRTANIHPSIKKMHHHLALLSLLLTATTASVSALVPNPYTLLPGWPVCDLCLPAVYKDGPIPAAEEPVCFDAAAGATAPEGPCGYWFCCGGRVSLAFFIFGVLLATYLSGDLVS